MASGSSLGTAVLDLGADDSGLTAALARAQTHTQSWLSTMTSMAAGILTAGLFTRIADGVMSIGQSAISNNAYFQTMSAGMEATLSDTAIAASAVGGTVAQAGAGAASSAGNAVRDVNERIQDAMVDHSQRLADIQSQILETNGQNIADRQEQLGEALASLAESHADRLAQIYQQISQSNEVYAEQQLARQQSLQENLDSMASSHADRRAAIEQQIADNADAFAQTEADRQASLQEQLTSLSQTHEDKRASLIDKMTTFAGKEKVDQLLAGQLTEQQIADEGLTALAKKLRQEDDTYAAQAKRIQDKAARTEADAQASHDRQVRQLEARLAKEDSDYDKATAKAQSRYDRELASAQRSHDRQVDALNARIAQENKAYDKQRDKLAADAAKDEAKLAAENAKKLTELDKQLDKENQSYARRMRDLQEQSSTAGAGMAAAVGKPIRQAYNDVTAMFEKGGFLYGIESEAERAQKVMDWVKTTALTLPGSAKDALQASQRFLVSHLDPTKWLLPAAGAAATFGVSVDQVARGLSALAQGRGGEAIQMLLDAGINVREALGNAAFDAAGSLTMGLDQAMPKINEWLTQRFGGALIKAQGTWANVTSNLGDIWDNFMTRLGGPLFKKLNDVLKDAMSWLLDPANATQINAISDSIANGLASAFDTVMRIVTTLGPKIAGFFSTLSSGNATGITTMLQGLTGIDLSRVLRIGGELVGIFRDDLLPTLRDDVIPFLRDTLVSVITDVLVPGLDELATFLEGTLIPAFRDQFIPLMRDTIIPTIGRVVDFIRDNATPILAALAAMTLMVVVPAFVVWGAAAATAAAATLVALAPILIPIAAVGLAVGLLAAAWQSNFLGIRDVVHSLWTGTIQPIFENIYEILADFWNVIQPKLASAWVSIQGTVTTVVKYIWESVIRPTMETLVAFWERNWGNIQSYLDGVWMAMQGIVKVAWALISGIVNVGLDLLAGNWSAAWTDMQTMLQGTLDGIRLFADGWFQAFNAMVQIAWDLVATTTRLAWSGTDGNGGIKGFLSGVWDGIKNAALFGWTQIANAIKGAINGIIDSINKMIKAWNDLGATIPGFNVQLPSVDVPGVGTVGGGSLSWPGVSISSPDINEIPHLAAGTDLWKGGLTMLGELGPEIAWLPQGSQVLPASQTASLLSGGGSPIDYDRLGDAYWKRQPARVQVSEIVWRAQLVEGLQRIADQLGGSGSPDYAIARSLGG